MTKPDQELLQQTDRLSDELRALWLLAGLLSAIQHFGPVSMGGSAALDLLTRRDVDVNLRLRDDLDTATFFSIGAALTRDFQVLKASYSNHFIRNFPGFDHGLYWGIQLKHAGQVWKLDLWGYGPRHFDAHCRQLEVLRDALGAVDRLAILRLKDTLREGDGYRHGVTGLDIYTAMASAGVRSVEQFEQWWFRRHPA